jgi:hypothetical protein
VASRAQWQKRVAQWKKSGLTAEDFAAQEGRSPGNSALVVVDVAATGRRRGRG